MVFISTAHRVLMMTFGDDDNDADDDDSNNGDDYDDNADIGFARIKWFSSSPPTQF